VFVHRVEKHFVEKIQSFKFIERAIRVNPDNVVINLIALRVGEIRSMDLH
jgi:hypothetical protein